jgi:hypothetical protein
VRTCHRKALFLVVAVALWSVTGARTARTAETNGRIAVGKADFHGWKAITLRSRAAEIVVVPAIGRVMRFDLLDENGGSRSGPFWNHPKFARSAVHDSDTGRNRAGGGVGGNGARRADVESNERPQPDSEGWTNYGGDKAWPAPQSEWSKVAGRGWPPPKGFDAMPYTATVEGDKVQLVSAIDPDYGVRVRRTIGLDPRKPVMTIETTYEKVGGRTINVGVWTIAQLDAPDRLFILLPQRHRSPAFSNGYNSLLPDPPQGLNIEGRVLSLGHDRRNKTMVNSDGDALLWVGNGPDLLIEDKTPGRAGGAGEWPNRGAHSQIYTSPAPGLDNKKLPEENNKEAYVELELLGRLHTLSSGGKAPIRTSYTLIRRTEHDAAVEARKVFARP